MMKATLLVSAALLAGTIAPAQDPKPANFVFEGKVCLVDGIEKGHRGARQIKALGTERLAGTGSAFLRVQGAFVPGPDTWTKEDKVRVEWPAVIPDGSEQRSYSLIDYIERDLNVWLRKPTPDDRAPPKNRLEIDSVFIVPDPWPGGVFRFGYSGPVMKIPAFGPLDSIVSKEPEILIHKAELLEEVQAPNSNVTISERPRKSLPETIRPADGKLLRVELEPLTTSSIRVSEVGVKTATGAVHGCLLFADVFRGKDLFNDLPERRFLNIRDEERRLALYFAVPANTTKFALLARDQQVEGTVPAAETEGGNR